MDCRSKSALPDVPAVLIQRIRGEHLDRYLGKHCGDRAALLLAAARFRDRLLNFESHQFAHGDLQDGNILVAHDDSGPTIWFADLDDCYLPGLTGSPSVGHPNYQHPGRTTRGFGPYMDSFSGLLVWIALRAIAADPQLWEENDDDGRLLFELRDLRKPGWTELWEALERSTDRMVREGATKLHDLCGSSTPPALSFTNLLPSW
jgi:hypothetical protein